MMNNPHYALSPLAGGDVLLRSFDGRAGFDNGKPVQEGVFARFLNKFRPDVSSLRNTQPGTLFAAGENAAAFIVDSLGVDRMMAYLHAGSAQRADLDRVLLPQASPQLSPRPSPRKQMKMKPRP